MLQGEAAIHITDRPIQGAFDEHRGTDNGLS